MTHRFPLRREIKSYAKKLMMNPLCLRATLMLVCMTVGLFGIRTVTGANLTMGLVNLADYADTATGFYRNSEGFSLILICKLGALICYVGLHISVKQDVSSPVQDLFHLRTCSVSVFSKEKSHQLRMYSIIRAKVSTKETADEVTVHRGVVTWEVDVFEAA